MAESTLSLTRTKIRREVAWVLNYQRRADTDEGLSTKQDADVDAIMEAGEARFAGAHDWGFLRPRVSFVLWSSVAVDAAVTVAQSGSTTLTATGGTPFRSSMVGHSIVITGEGTYTITGYTSSTVVTVDTSDTYTGKTFSIAADGIYRLPDDFGGMESTQLEYDRDSGHLFLINMVNESIIQRAWQINDATGRPRQAATRVVENDGTGQRWDLITEPIADTNYTCSFRYNKLPNAMANGTDYGAGGMLMSDALLKCCLAAAEEKHFENQNIWAVQEAKALEKAIRFDLRYNRARRLGRTTTSNFQAVEDAMVGRVTGFVYRGVTYDVEV